MKITKRLCCLLLTTLLLIPALSLGEAAQAEAQPVNAIEVLQQEGIIDLTPYEGKAIFMNFFTEWCPYCMQELPDIKKAYETYSQDDLQIILVHVWDGEDESNTERIKATYGLEEMTFFEDKDRMLSYVMGLQSYPLSVFINKDGTIHSGVMGAISPEAIQAKMAELGVAEKESDNAAKDEVQ